MRFKNEISNFSSQQTQKIFIQEDGKLEKLSVFRVFCELFPEIDSIQGEVY